MNDKYINNAGLELTVIQKEGKKCLVVFTETGSTRTANIDNIKAGKVKDLYYPSRYGIGYDGDFNKIPHWKRARDLWSNMLKRCYFEKDPKGYYGSVFVAPRWHCFANFLTDISTLEGFNMWLNKEGMELDKDMIIGNRTYSKDTCQFITAKLNRQLQPNYRVGKEFCRETRSWINAL